MILYLYVYVSIVTIFYTIDNNYVIEIVILYLYIFFKNVIDKV